MLDVQDFEQGFTKVKERKGLLAIYAKIRHLIATINYEVGWYFDLVEKFVKAFSWTNVSTSSLIMYLLLVAWVVVTFIPIRGVIALGIFKKFDTESRFYKRRYISNYECSRIAIRNFFYY